MTAPAQLSVDASFDHLGIDAVIDPDGAAIAVRLVPDQASGDVQFGGLNLQDDRGIFQIRAADWQGHANGVILDIGGERRRVQSVSVPDRLRLKRVLNTVAEV